MAIIKKFRIKSFKKDKPLIKLEKIPLSFGKRQILDNISFNVNSGEILGMLGPNGVGKSILFNLIIGLIMYAVAAVIMIIQYHKIIANTDNGNLTVDRYISRMVISPLALLILLLIITKNTGASLGIGSYIIILVLNYLTLGSAYLGIKGNLDKKKANIMSVIFLVILFVYIYITFMNGRNNLANSVIFGIIAVLWFVFTCIYREKDENKKFVYHNVLDLGGSLFGLFIWAYLSNIFLLK